MGDREDEQAPGPMPSFTATLMASRNRRVDGIANSWMQLRKRGRRTRHVRPCSAGNGQSGG